MTCRTRRSATIAIPVLLMIAAVVAVSAHHGWTGYEDKARTLTGTIKASGYENPHGYVDLDVDGKTTWRVVLAPPSRMTSRGLEKEALKVGTKATVEGYQHKTEKTEMRAERITIGGKTVELR